MKFDVLPVSSVLRCIYEERGGRGFIVGGTKGAGIQKTKGSLISKDGYYPIDIRRDCKEGIRMLQTQSMLNKEWVSK